MSNDDMVRLKAPPGTDEANVGETRYHVRDDGTITVPREVATALETGASGFVEVGPHHTPCMDLVPIRGPAGAVSVGWDGKTYEADDRGRIMVPLMAVPDLAPHGFGIATDL